MDMYQHDSPEAFRFVLRSDLRGDDVQELEHAWATAQSILRTKDLLVDISGVKDADAAGMELLSRMRAAGARLVAASPPASVEFVRSMGLPVASRGEARAKPFLAFFRRAEIARQEK